MHCITVFSLVQEVLELILCRVQWASLLPLLSFGGDRRHASGDRASCNEAVRNVLPSLWAWLSVMWKLPSCAARVLRPLLDAGWGVSARSPQSQECCQLLEVLNCRPLLVFGWGICIVPQMAIVKLNMLRIIGVMI